MKKFGIVVLSFLVSFSLISATLAADLFEKDIKYGVANNNDVKQLQDFLYNEGFYKGPITGNFYTLTRNALKKYQLANKITPANGLLNKVTREKLNATLLAQEESEEVLGSDDVGYTADDEAARLAWVARMTSLQNQNVSQQLVPQPVPQPVINNYYTSPVTYNVLPVVTSSPQIVQTPQPTPNQVVVTTTTIQTTSTPVATPPPVVVTNINWNMGGMSMFGSGYTPSGDTLNRIDNGDGTGTFGILPYYYHYICSTNNPFPTWGSMQGYGGFKKDVPNDTLGEGTVIDTRGEFIVGSFWINGSGINQYTTGPFIKSFIIQNTGTTDLTKIGLYGFNANFTDGLRIEPSNTTSNTATFNFPSNIKYLGLGLKIDSSKMNRGETLNLQVTNVELTSPDPTKNYIYTYPTVDSQTKTLIKCDNRV